MSEISFQTYIILIRLESTNNIRDLIESVYSTEDWVNNVRNIEK